MKNILGTSQDTIIEANFVKGSNTFINSRSVITSSTNANITPRQLLSGHIRRSGFNNNITDTFPSATELVNLIPNCQIGDSFIFTYYVTPSSWNISGAGTTGVTWNIGVGSGATNKGSFTNFQFSSSVQAFIYTGRIVITSVSSPAYDLLRLANVGSLV